MDFVTVLLCSSKDNNVIWLIIDHLTKIAQFISFCVRQSVKNLGEKYVHEMVRLHDVLVSIM